MGKIQLNPNGPVLKLDCTVLSVQLYIVYVSKSMLFSPQIFSILLSTFRVGSYIM